MLFKAFNCSASPPILLHFWQCREAPIVEGWLQSREQLDLHNEHNNAPAVYAFHEQRRRLRAN